MFQFRSATVTALAALLAGLVISCSRKEPAAPAPLDIGIFLTCDTNGRLEPCGCFTGQYGGLSRLKTMLDTLPDSPGLRVDAGDALAGTEDYHLVEHRYMLRAFELMKFDALNIGRREARLSLVQLRELRGRSPVPFVSANVRDTKTGELIFEAFRIVQRGPWRIGIVGVLDPQGTNDRLGDGVTVERMESALARVLPELRRQTDMVVLLAFANESALARLAEEFYEPDIILGGAVSQPSQRLDKVNRSLIYFTTNESRALAMMRLRLTGRQRLAVESSEIRLLADTIPESPVIRSLAADYRKEVRGKKLAIDSLEHLNDSMVPGVHSAATFVGSETCVTCHASAAAIWEKTGHSRAFEALIRRDADADPKCISCHTVGFGTPSGYRRELGRKQLVNVGCESCHGAGGLHARQRAENAPDPFRFRPLAAGDCKKCHYGEFSRSFDWDEFWPLIRHGRETGVVKTATTK